MNDDAKPTIEELMEKHYSDGWYDVGTKSDHDYSKYDLAEKRITNEKSLSQVGRVITQRGLVGALVLSFNPEDRVFKVQLEDGTISDGHWVTGWAPYVDPSGITSNGWSVGDIEPDDDDIPF
jgi:hypothetical protein